MIPLEVQSRPIEIKAPAPVTDGSEWRVIFDDGLESPTDRPINCGRGGFYPDQLNINKVLGRSSAFERAILANRGNLVGRKINGFAVPDFIINSRASIEDKARTVQELIGSAHKLYLDIGTGNQPAVWATKKILEGEPALVLNIDNNHIQLETPQEECADTHPLMSPGLLYVYANPDLPKYAINVRIDIELQDLQSQAGLVQIFDTARFVAPSPGMLSSIGSNGKSLIESAEAATKASGSIVVVINRDATTKAEILAKRQQDTLEMTRVAKESHRNISSIDISPQELGVFMNPNANSEERSVVIAKYGIETLTTIGEFSSSYIYLYDDVRSNGKISKADPRPLTVYILSPKGEEQPENEPEKVRQADPTTVIIIFLAAMGLLGINGVANRRKSSYQSVEAKIPVSGTKPVRTRRK